MTSQSGSTNVPTAGSRPRCNRRRAGAAIVALLAVVGGAVVSTAAVAQENTTGSDSTAVRIVARKLESGRIEFGLQQRQSDKHVRRPPAAPRPFLPHHRHRRQLARQLAAHPHSAPDRRPIHRPIHRPLLRRHRRLVVFVRAAHQRHHHLLGQVGFPHGITVGSPPGVDLLGFRGRRGHPAPAASSTRRIAEGDRLGAAGVS